MTMGDFDQRFEDTRNPAAVWAEFHEAMRRDRICHTIGMEFVDRPRLDLDRPAFDVCSVTHRVDRDYDWYIHAVRRARDLANAGRLTPGGTDCALLLEFVNDDEIGDAILTLDRTVVKSPTSETDGWMMLHFERGYNRSSGECYKMGPKGYEWYCGSRMFIPIIGEGYAVENSIDCFGPSLPDVAGLDTAALGVEQRTFYYITMACLGAIGAEPELHDAPPSAVATSVNAGRVRGKLRPLPAVRILNVDRVIWPSRPAGAPTGREMPPHFRRGTIRTLRHPRYGQNIGKQIEIPATNVRPDKGIVTPPVYKVIV
jgi:hypothetical protein